jgi:hypothetical protein
MDLHSEEDAVELRDKYKTYLAAPLLQRTLHSISYSGSELRKACGLRLQEWPPTYSQFLLYLRNASVYSVHQS